MNGDPHVTHPVDFYPDGSLAPEPTPSTINVPNRGGVKVRVTEAGTYYSTEKMQQEVFMSVQDENEDPQSDLVVAGKLGVDVKELMAARFFDVCRPTTFEELAEVLGSTIRHDRSNKLILLCGGILTFTDQDQSNFIMSGESSGGKSYTALEIASYFPEGIVRVMATASPTAFFHEHGTWDSESHVLRVDLRQKLLIFLDQPHYSLMERLRPLLSHDRKELLYKITDKSKRGSLRTKSVALMGFPTVFFCASGLALDEQEKTRTFILSPETDQGKLQESVLLRIKRDSDREAFSDWVNLHPRRRWLKARINEIRKAAIDQVVVQDQELVYERFLKSHPRLAPRHQRDISRILCLVKAHALLNFWHREHLREHTIAANREDVEAGFALYREVAESNELGLSPQLYEIYTAVIRPLLDPERPLRKDMIASTYLERFGRPLPWRRLDREILPALEAATLIRLEPDPNDRRRTVVYPPHAGNISQPETILPQYGDTPPSQDKKIVGPLDQALSDRSSGVCP
jgi:hypothetical protein